MFRSRFAGGERNVSLEGFVCGKGEGEDEKMLECIKLYTIFLDN